MWKSGFAMKATLGWNCDFAALFPLIKSTDQSSYLSLARTTMGVHSDGGKGLLMAAASTTVIA